MNNSNCYFCKEKKYKLNLCKEHYNLMCVYLKKMNSINIDNINYKKEIRSHFHNLRYSGIKCINYENFVSISIRLYSMAIYYKYKYNDSQLLEKNYMFLSKYLYKKQKMNLLINEAYNDYLINKISDIDFREKWPKSYVCDDGHCVRSLSEMLIDNWLFRNGYSHVYEKIIDIQKDNKSLMVCDFYLPDLDIYIEYWGKYDEKYIARKHAKRKIYNDYNLKLIELDYESIKRINEVMAKKIKKEE